MHQVSHGESMGEKKNKGRNNQSFSGYKLKFLGGMLGGSMTMRRFYFLIFEVLYLYIEKVINFNLFLYI